jgi:hypothetical protein
MSSGGALIRLNFATRPAVLAADALALEVLIFDPAKGEFIAVPLVVARSGARNQRSVTSTPIVIGLNDQIINCNIATPAACTLPQASTRNGIPLTFKDVGAQFGVNNLTITPFAGDTIDAAATLVLNTNRLNMNLVPFNDGVNTGWAIE